MIAHSIQIAELLPNSFVKIILNSGLHKYGFIQNSSCWENQLLIVSRPDSTEDFSKMSFETIDANTVVSVDPYLK